MARHNEIGRLGEQIALKYFKENNYKIFEKNWRYKRAEVDLIVKDKEDGSVVFVEVKTRSSDFFGNPEDAVGQKKEGMLIKAAEAYVEEFKILSEIRFDVLSIVMDGNETKEIMHLKDAFFGLE